MIFSSLTFLVFFLIVLGLIWALRSDQTKRRMLLLASYIFYGAWDWRFCSLILASSLWSWWLGLRMAATDDVRWRRRYLALSLCMDLGLLGVFKYANFFLDSFYGVTGLVRSTALDITLPVGISFFTFQTMSYTIDLYRRRIEVCRDVERFMLFVSFFPQLVAGPIVRAAEFLPQLDKPIRLTRKDLSIGLQIFVLGLTQKLLIADNLSQYVDPVFIRPSLYDAATLWAALAGYSVQIFCDFSGYSLMAIGVARCMGFQLPENFRTPYISRTITEFWRRWHISLSTWLRDYLYISLGGNRKGKVRADVNVAATMLLGGLWHGAGWNFVLWGAMHGGALIAQKHWSARFRAAERFRGAAHAAWSGLSWAVTLLFVMLTWVPFRAANFTTASAYFQGLVDFEVRVQWLHGPSLILLALMVGWHALHAAQSRAVRILPTEQPMKMAPLWTLAVLIMAVLMFAPLAASPFIYFQF